MEDINSNVSENSIYNLLTTLCENFLTHRDNVPKKLIKRCRSKAYEILLSKKIPKQADQITLEDNNDPYCYLLAWQYVLINHHDLPNHAQKIQKCISTLQELNCLNERVLADVLYVLLKLCRLPEQNNTISMSSLTTCESEKAMKFRYFDSAKFKLSVPMICSESRFSNESFLLKTKRNIRAYEFFRTGYSENNICKECHIPLKISCSSSESNAKEDEERKTSVDVTEQCDIWDLVSKTEFTNHRTWETLGNSHPNKELPFLTEAPSSVCSNLYKMHTSNVFQIIGENNSNQLVTTEQKNFICDVKHLLVGITSKSFKRDCDGNMYLVPGTTTEGVTPGAMEYYCQDLLLCSNYYSSLDKLCNYQSPLQDYQPQGFIFKELCDSVSRYLAYYRLAIQNISENGCLLTVHNYIRPLLSHLTELGSVCKVGSSEGQLPDGVALLVHIYKCTIDLANKDVIMVLYSLLYPCIQLYFTRFLQQWLFEGALSDPYSEFFIFSDPSYLRTRGRTYWTRSHRIDTDKIPPFLDDLVEDILLCGKTLNLLKLCVPSSPLCMYLMGKKPNLLSCCLSSEQTSALETNAMGYYLEVMAECGPRFQLENFIVKSSEQNMVFMNLVTKKRAATIKRLELEKLKRVEEELEKKRKAMTELKHQYDEALQTKKMQLIADIERELKTNEEILKMQNLRQKLIAEESMNIIEYYEELNAITEKKRRDIQNHIEKLKKIDLDSSIHSVHGSSEENVSNDVSIASIGEDPIQVAPLDKSVDVDEKSASSSNETFVSAKSELSKESQVYEVAKQQVDSEESINKIHSSTSLDVINANSEGDAKIPEVARIATENFELARRNRIKVLCEEMGFKEIDIKTAQKPKPKDLNGKVILSDLEKNRLKVMSSEFDIHISPEKVLRKRELSCCEINRNKIMGSSECFQYPEDDNQIILQDKRILDNEKLIKNIINLNDTKTNLEGQHTLLINSVCNENYTNSNANLEDNGNTETRVGSEENGNDLDETIKEKMKVEQRNLLNKSVNNNFKPANLKLDLSKLTNVQQIQPKNSDSIFSKFLKSPNFELDKPLPMSLDSTPCLDSAASKVQGIIDREALENMESGATTAATNFTDEGFNFYEVNNKMEPLLLMHKHLGGKLLERTSLSKRVSIRDVENMSTRSLKMFIQESVAIPVNTQLRLVNNELLKYFFVDLQFLTHLNSLRNYFFLLDGEFGRNITEGLFEKLYDVNFPVDLINCRTLQHLVYNAIDSSIKLQENSGCLSFKINSLPKAFNLEDPDVLGCLSLTYKVDWPLNVLLPSDTIAKYDDVFKFLLKLNRISWVLKKMLQDLKMVSKEAGKRETYVILSHQFQKIHQYRHIMTHFVQTLQNYVVAEVLQTSWDAFEKKLVTTNNIDELYSLHVSYIKNILFMCLLNQRSMPIQKLISKLFTVILKFYNYLRASQWVFDEEYCVYEHSNFKKLADIFQNFEELAAYFAKAADKIAKVGYQPHLSQLLDMLNVNDYYTCKHVSCSQSNISTLSNPNTSL